MSDQQLIEVIEATKPLDRIAVNEFYPAIQGEGPTCGRPVLFVRLSECNLSCSWCDTPYTWDWTGKNGVKYERSEEQRRLSIVDFLIKVNDQLRLHDLERVVLTGGEPMLWQRQLAKVWYDVKAYWLEVETNGTVPIVADFDRFVKQYNVAPKLSNSGDPESKRITRALASYALEARRERAIFKFVVTCEEDLNEIYALERQFEIPRSQIYLMAEGKTRDEQVAKMQWVTEIALRRKYNVTPRMHVLTYDAKRGV
jgi:organic radical activating enzyme